MDEYLSQTYLCPENNKELYKSNIKSQLRRYRNLRIRKQYSFNNMMDYEYFNKKLNHTKEHLLHSKLINNEYAKEFELLNLEDATTIKNIQREINQIIDQKLIELIQLQDKIIFSESDSKQVKLLMMKKLTIEIDYPYFLRTRNHLKLSEENFIKFKLRKRFCKKILTSSLNSIPSCGLLCKDDKFLILGFQDSTIKVINLEKYSIRKIFHGHLAKVVTLTLFDNDKKLISCSYDNTIKVWDLKRRRLILNKTDHLFPIVDSCINFNKSKFASLDSSGCLIIWDLSNWKPVNKSNDFQDFRIIRFITNNSLVIMNKFLSLKFFPDTTAYPELQTIVENSKFLEVSSDGSFMIFCSIDLEISEYDISTRRLSLIDRDLDLKPKSITIINNNTTLVVPICNLWQVKIINIKTRQSYYICTLIDNLLLVKSVHSNCFSVVNVRCSVEYFNTNPDNNDINSIKSHKIISTADFYIMKNIECINKETGIIHLLDECNYKILNVENRTTTIISKYIYTFLTFKYNCIYLGNLEGIVYFFDFQHMNRSKESDARFFFDDAKETLFSFSSMIGNHTFSREVNYLKVSDSSKYLAISIKRELIVIFNLIKKLVVNRFIFEPITQECNFSNSDKHVLVLAETGFAVIFDIRSGQLIRRIFISHIIKSLKQSDKENFFIMKHYNGEKRQVNIMSI